MTIPYPAITIPADLTAKPPPEAQTSNRGVVVGGVLLRGLCLTHLDRSAALKGRARSSILPFFYARSFPLKGQSPIRYLESRGDHAEVNNSALKEAAVW